MSRRNKKSGGIQTTFEELDALNDTMKDLEKGEECREYEEWGLVEGVAQKLGSSLENGLSDYESDERQRMFGVNELPESPRDSFFELLLSALNDIAVIILIIAAIVSLVVGSIEMATTPAGEEVEPAWIEGVAILAAVVIVTFVTAINDYTKENQFRDLSKAEQDIQIRVRRNGEEHQISILHLLVGDIALLTTGDGIPADGIFVKGYDLYLDTSAMTGETVDVHKGPEDPYLLSGCKVSSGVGEMIVTAVGPNSEWGKTVAKLQTPEEETPLQEKLEGLVILIGEVGLAFAIATLIVLGIRWLDHYVFSNTSGETLALGDYLELLEALIISITIVVVAVPEGLPLAVTISLAYSVGQMMEDNNLVRHLSACETMGGATNICSDKTGTLTENRMTVVRGFFGGLEFEAKEEIESFKNELAGNGGEFLELLRECVAINSDAQYNHLEDGTLEFVGNKTECGLLVFGDKLGDDDYRAMRKEHTKVQIVAFSSARKRMSTVIPVPEPSSKTLNKWKKKGEDYIDLDHDYRIYSKGAPEVLIEFCTQVKDADGGIRALEKDDVKYIIAQQEAMARRGLRTLLLAYRDIPAGTEWTNAESVENDLVILGLAGIEDPLRAGVTEAVHACQRAGITVRMVTGDNILTAKKIAEDCGILTSGGIAMTGPDFRNLNPQELDDILPRLQVVARSSPTDKYILVSRLRQNGEVVSVTGDGTNDAPALKEADVGLSMGIAGTQVAKEASDIVILDDNFNSIVRSVVWGRSVYDNIRKFIQFQLTINVVALFVAFLGALFGFGTPLTAVQLLWVNLIMDTMAALALGTEKPTDALLLRKPYGRDSSLISWIMYKNIAVHSVYQLALLLVMLFAVDGTTGYHLFFPSVDSGLNYNGRTSVHYTMVFNTFVFCQVFNEFNSRKCDRSLNVFTGLFTNIIFVLVIIATVIVQFLVVQFTGDFANCAPLNFEQWAICVCLGFFSLFIGYVGRIVLNPIIPYESWEKTSSNVISKKIDS